MGLFSRFRLPAVRADEARQMIDSGAALLDVREKAEWNAGHAPTAVHVPMGRMADAPRRLKQGRPVVVACRSGNRSRRVTAYLHRMGYEAYNLRGGMRAWEAAGGRVVSKGTRPGAVV